jgi:ATP-binding cassette subfamily F protein uup
MGNIIAELNDVSLTLGGKQLLNHFTFHFEAGMRLGVIGRNDMGKTSLLRLILGELQPDAGQVRIGERVIFNYVEQHRVILHNEKTVFEEVGEGNDFVIFDNRKLNLWTYLKNFLFQDDEINSLIGQLSGGERNRIVLAKILKEGGNFLLMDEPTNDLDLPTLRVLEEALMEFDGCMAIVSHDRYFLNRVCTDILAFEGDAKVVHQPGNYTYYAQKLAERRQAAQLSTQTAQPASTSRSSHQEPSRPRKLKWAEKKELEGMEEAIAQAENAVAELEAIFSRPDFHIKYGKQTAELTEKLAMAKQEVERLYNRWAELEAIEGN